MNCQRASICRSPLRWLATLLLAFAAAGAAAQADPPGRVATLSQVQGSVAFAPAGETEWAEVAINRPITRGDRLWTDAGARAELQLGSAALHIDSQTFLEVVALDDDVMQLNLNEGVVNARVRELEDGENFEIDTPQLAFRAAQPGDFRIDVDPVSGTTRVTVRSGAGVVHGAGGGSMQLQAGQQLAFEGPDLTLASAPLPAVDEGFERWAAERNRSEDLSISARYVPRGVVGYPQLDAHGVWTQDPGYGAVWYPQVSAPDWAPYRYGRWDWIAPWGWTWIDDAPWGFAPFHYGRWAQIGSRWAWVPGQLDPHPVYAPALVSFVGGQGANWDLSIGAGPGIGWFPLAPGETWRPVFRSSPVYLRKANRHLGAHRANDRHIHQRRSDAITAVRVDDFHRGRPVQRHWKRVNAAELGRAPTPDHAVLPAPRRWADGDRAGRGDRSDGARRWRDQPALQPAAPIMAQPGARFQNRAALEARERDDGRVFRPRDDASWRQRRSDDLREAQTIENRAQHERQQNAQRLQDEQRRQQAQQMRQQDWFNREQQGHMQRQREESERRQREFAVRQQQAQDEHALRQQRAQAQHEHALRQQQQAQQRFQHRQDSGLQRSAPQVRQPLAPSMTIQPPAPDMRREHRDPGAERGSRAQPHDRAGPRGDDWGRGQGRGHRQFN